MQEAKSLAKSPDFALANYEVTTNKMVAAHDSVCILIETALKEVRSESVRSLMSAIRFSTRQAQFMLLNLLAEHDLWTKADFKRNFDLLDAQKVLSEVVAISVSQAQVHELELVLVTDPERNSQVLLTNVLFMKQVLLNVVRTATILAKQNSRIEVKSSSEKAKKVCKQVFCVEFEPKK